MKLSLPQIQAFHRARERERARLSKHRKGKVPLSGVQIAAALAEFDRNYLAGLRARPKRKQRA